jgi:LmbE family N-acetylglucosaminyl deacetylase
MLSLSFHSPSDRTLNILCLGAHSDDIEIGCGGTILKLLKQRKRTRVSWIVFGSDENEHRADEARESANAFLRRAESKTVVTNTFRNSFFPYRGAEIKEYFEQLKREFSPDVVFTHYRNDFHQDHRLISELTWNSFRDHLILEYEIPKYDGDLGSPNFFVPLEELTAREKVSFLMEYFPSQKEKHWFDEETFLALLRLRGMESNSSSRYAEGFYCRKMALADL